MKRAVSLLTALLLCAGCGVIPPADRTAAVQEALRADCTFTADFCYETLEGSAEVTKAGDSFAVTLLEPGTLAGLSITFGAEEFTVTREEMTMTLPCGSLPQEALVAVLRRATGGGDALTVEETNGILTATADQVLFHYIVELDAESLTPQRITVPELSIEIAIRDYAACKGK